MNAGLLHHTTCGQPPIAPTAVTATVTAANGTTVPQTYVTHHLDEVHRRRRGREGRRAIRDLPPVVERRRRSTSPFASVPGGACRRTVPRHRRAERPDVDLRRGGAGLHAIELRRSPQHQPWSFHEDSIHEASLTNRRRLRALSSRARATRHRAVRHDVLRRRHRRARALGHLSHGERHAAQQDVREGRRSQVHVRGGAGRSARRSSTSIQPRCRTPATSR